MAGEHRRHQGALRHRRRPLLGLIERGDRLGRRWSKRSASKRGAVTASRSRSNASSHLADNTRIQPPTGRAQAPKPSDTAVSSWRCLKACASSGPAPVGQQGCGDAGHVPCAPRNRRALPPSKEKDSDTTGVLWSSTSHALRPSGVVTSRRRIFTRQSRPAAGVIAARADASRVVAPDMARGGNDVVRPYRGDRLRPVSTSAMVPPVASSEP